MERVVERRYLLVDDCPDALRVDRRDGEPARIGGISPPWNSWSVDLGGFREQFLPTSFDDLLDPSGVLRSKWDVPFLFNHDNNLITGRTSNNRLEVRKADKGLEYLHTPLLTTHGRDLAMLVEDRTVKAASFAFTTHPKGDLWEEDARGNITRTVSRVDGLYDISAVTNPAYPKSSASPRSLEQWRHARGLVAHRGEGGKRLTIAIDYDAAFVAAPGLWRSLCVDATRRGDEVLLVSASEHRERIEADVLELADGLAVRTEFVPADGSRRSALYARGIAVDAWVMGGDGEQAAPPVKVSSLLGVRAAAAARLARMRSALGS
jgi:HK97 family phage prohead protease